MSYGVSVGLTQLTISKLQEGKGNSIMNYHLSRHTNADSNESNE